MSIFKNWIQYLLNVIPIVFIKGQQKLETAINSPISLVVQVVRLPVQVVDIQKYTLRDNNCSIQF